MDFRFAAHDPRTGEFLRLMPSPVSVQIGDTFGTRGTLVLSYAGSPEIETFLEVRAQVSFGGEWEQVGPALLRLGGSHEDTDASGMRTIEFVSREWVLGKARVGEGELPLVDGKRPFYQASPGEIMRALLLEAQDRGAAQGIELGPFDAATDSAGAPWSKVATIYYSPGLPIASVLENLVDQGMCDYRMNGRTLELFEPDTAMGRDLTVGDPVRIHGAVTEAPVTYTLEDLTTSALLIGEEGFQVEVANPSAPRDYGELEVTIEQGGVNSEATARTMIDAELQRGSREIREITRSQAAAHARHLPFRDYRVGDYVQALDNGRWERYRVREVQIVRDGDGWTVHTVLNDRLQELLLKLAKRTSGIVNGSRGSGGDGTPPAPPRRPGLEPAAPQGLVVDQQVYIDGAGDARGVVTAGWGEVTESVRGRAIDVGGYELWRRDNETYAPWRLVARTDGSAEATDAPVWLTRSDGSAAEYQWRVRAVAQESGREGSWSEPVTLTMTQDTTPPPLPSAPVVSTGFRIVSAEWDGLTADGTEMPTDFARVRVYIGTAESMSDARQVGSLPYPGTWNSETMPAGVQVWVAFTAVDRVGNESAMTAAVSVTPRALVDEGAIRDQLAGLADGTLIEDDAITSPKILAGAITAGKIASLAVEAGHIAANAVEADTIAGGAIDGKIITGATVRTSATGARVQLDANGLYAYNASGSLTSSISAQTGAVDLTGNITQRNSYGAAIFGPQPYSSSTASPGIAFDVPGYNWYGPGGLYARDDGSAGFPVTRLQGFVNGETDGSSISLAPGGTSTGAATFLRRGHSSGAMSILALEADRRIFLDTDAGDILIRSRNANNTATNSGLYLRQNGEADLWGFNGNRVRANSSGITMNGVIGRYITGPMSQMVVGNGGIIGVDGSSRRWKSSIEHVDPATYEDGLLEIDYASWLSRDDVRLAAEFKAWRAENPMCPTPPEYGYVDEEPIRQYGVIAEEVHATGVPGLVGYGEDGEPESVNRANFGIALIPIVKRLRDRVAELEARIGELDG